MARVRNRSKKQTPVDTTPTAPAAGHLEGSAALLEAYVAILTVGALSNPVEQRITLLLDWLDARGTPTDRLESYFAARALPSASDTWGALVVKHIEVLADADTRLVVLAAYCDELVLSADRDMVVYVELVMTAMAAA